MATPHGHQPQRPVHLDEADWAAFAAHTEIEGQLLLAFVTDTVRWMTELRGADAPPVRRVLDIGSGPGVGTCELARMFPDAQVVAIDGSLAMLERATQRAAADGLDDRISTRLAEVPDGLDDLDPADVIWASMSLHHIGDETSALRVLCDKLAPSGVLALAEVADPTRVLPDDLEIGRPGLADRVDRAESAWFASMRADLSAGVPSTDLTSMLTAAGFDVIGSRVAEARFDAPLSDIAREVVIGRLRRARHQLSELLDEDDLRTLDELSDANSRHCAAVRPDAFLAASRHIVVARPTQVASG
jgi:SAM-dependent methyltransferase